MRTTSFTCDWCKQFFRTAPEPVITIKIGSSDFWVGSRYIEVCSWLCARIVCLNDGKRKSMMGLVKKDVGREQSILEAGF